MKRYKKLYILSIILIAVVLTSVCFSYAFFANKNEQHGKLNIVVGDLKYRLECDDLIDNSILVAPGEIKKLTIKLTSLNNISSKYEIYYNLTNSNNVEVGYLNVPASGTIGANEVINIEVGIKNKGTSSTIVTFGLEKGLINNQIALASGNMLNKINLCEYKEGYVWDFDYTGGEQSFIVPCSGTYKLEVWGAQGGSITYEENNYTGGYGAYSKGSTILNYNEKIYIDVGGKGLSGTETTLIGGYNGGGSITETIGGNRYASSGGGATHIAKQSGLLKNLSNNKNSILIVSGGGGGAYKHTDPSDTYEGNGGSAGGIIGVNGEAKAQTKAKTSYYGLGGTQTSAGCAFDTSNEACGGFGYGGNAGTSTHGSAGGSGYYGGGGSAAYSGTANSSGGGGSSYIGNTLLSNKSMYCYNCQESNDISTKTISTTCHSSTPITNCAKEDNGYVRITYISSIDNEHKIGDTWNYEYTGTEQVFQVPVAGKYKIELWGASGNNNYSNYTSNNPSYAGYVSGNISLNLSDTIYLYVGGTKQIFNACLVQGLNAGSGGATDIRLVNGAWNNFESLKSRIIVAGGSGGSYTDNTAPGGGSAGGLESYSVSHGYHPVYISGQTYSGNNGYNGEKGTFGIGGNTLQTNYNCGAGGYYGGSGGPAGGGGSSFISGHNGCDAISKSSTSSNIIHTGQPNHYSGYVFTNTVMIDGQGYNWTNTKGSYVGQPQPDGTTTTGHSGNGYAKITLVSLN